MSSPSAPSVLSVPPPPGAPSLLWHAWLPLPPKGVNHSSNPVVVGGRLRFIKDKSMREWAENARTCALCQNPPILAAGTLVTVALEFLVPSVRWDIDAHAKSVLDLCREFWGRVPPGTEVRWRQHRDGTRSPLAPPTWDDKSVALLVLHKVVLPKSEPEKRGVGVRLYEYDEKWHWAGVL